VNWLQILGKVWNLPQPTRDKVFQVVSLIAELTNDPNIKALLDSLKAQPQA
jgi:hypothetical protein